MDSIAELLDHAERSAGNRPLVTFHDLGTGERTELGVTTAANWARKTGNLLVEEFGAGPGAVVGVVPFSHWAAPVLALGAWAVGAGVSTTAQALVWFAAEDDAAGCRGRPLLVVGRGPGGRATADPVEFDGMGYVEEVLAFPDLLDADPGEPTALAVDTDRRLDHAELLRAAGTAHGRVLLDATPFSATWCRTLVAALASGDGIVLLRGGGREAREHVAAQERVHGHVR